MNKRKLIFLAVLSFLLAAVSLFSSLWLFIHDDNKSFLLVIVVIVLIFTFLAQLISMRNNMFRYFNDLDHKKEQSKSFALYNAPEPIVVTDTQNRIVWYNHSFFSKIAEETETYGSDICSLLECSDTELTDDNAFSIKVNSSVFDVKCCITDAYNSKMKTLYFNDTTDYTNLLEEYNSKKTTIGLIVIDNYDDIFQDVKESSKSATQADMEKMFENLTAGSNSLIKRLSKDKFIIVFEETHLNEIIKDRFKILDEARAIPTANDTAITLSIGIGTCSSSVAESDMFARQALDMAIGRGGDQAAVKTENGFEFFGGMSKGIEKHSRIKVRMVSNSIQKIIENASNVFIMGHRFSDLDAIGSAVGLSSAISALGKKSFIITNENESLALPLIKKIKAEKNICSFISETEARELTNPDSLLILVDTHKRVCTEYPSFCDAIKNIIVIDHHRKDVNFISNALIFYHEPFASSASEMVTEIIPYFKNLTKIPPAAAEALLAGIMLDTKNFIIKTGIRTFEAAAYLKKMGADTVSTRELFSNPIELYTAKAKIVSDANIHEKFAVSVVRDTSEINEATRIISSQAADELLTIEGVEAAFVIFPLEDEINISARSYGTVNVHIIMEKLNGGGHMTMAATQIKNSTVEKAEEMLMGALKEYQQEYPDDKNALPENK